jgi:hypothetical protein
MRLDLEGRAQKPIETRPNSGHAFAALAELRRG